MEGALEPKTVWITDWSQDFRSGSMLSMARQKPEVILHLDANWERRSGFFKSQQHSLRSTGNHTVGRYSKGEPRHPAQGGLFLSHTENQRGQ